MARSSIRHKPPCPRVIGTLLMTGLLAGCASPPEPARTRHAGELNIVLQNIDERDSCAVTLGLRNTSEVRQGVGRIDVQWLDAETQPLAASRIRFDPLRVGRYDAANEVLAFPCESVDAVRIGSAEWEVFHGWTADFVEIADIDGVAGTRWTLSWEAEHQAFIARPVARAP